MAGSAILLLQLLTYGTEQNQLSFDQTCIQDRANSVLRKMNSLRRENAGDNDWNADEDPNMIDLEELQEDLDQQKELTDSQLKKLSADLANLEKALDAAIKQENPSKQ